MDARKPSGQPPEADPELANIAAARRGDPAALAELLRAHRRPLWRVAFALARDRVRAERMLRELARRAYRERAQLEPGRSALPLFVRLLCEPVNPTLESSAAGGSARRPNGEPWGERNGAVHPQWERRLLTLFAQLPAADQAMLALRLFDRMSVNGVAAAGSSTAIATLQRLSELRTNIADEMAKVRPAA